MLATGILRYIRGPLAKRRFDLTPFYGQPLGLIRICVWLSRPCCVVTMDSGTASRRMWKKRIKDANERGMPRQSQDSPVAECFSL